MRFWRDKILHRLIACDSKPERFTTLPVSCVPTNPARNAANQARNAKFRNYVFRRKTALCSKYGRALGSRQMPMRFPTHVQRVNPKTTAVGFGFPFHTGDLMSSIRLATLAAISAFAAAGCQPSCPAQAPCPVAEACEACKIDNSADKLPSDTENTEINDNMNQNAKVGVKSRSDIPANFLWKTDRLFASHDAFKKALDETSRETANLENCAPFDSAENLNACLDLYFKLHTDVNKLTLYSNMIVDTQPTPTAREDQKLASAVLSSFMERSKGIRNNLLKLPKSTLDSYFNALPELQKHKSYIENIVRRAERVLSPDAERVLTLAGDNLWAEIDLNEIHSNSEDVFDAMLSSMDLPIIKDEAGKDVQLTLANYAKYRKSDNRNIRKSAVDGLMKTLQKYEDVFANAYIGQIKNDILFARARNYNTALEAYLDKDDIPVSIYENLISTVGKNLAPLHRYVELRKRILHLDDVHLYDMYIPLSKNVGKTYTYDDAVKIITDALKPLGDDYIQKLSAEMDLSKGSIDLLPYDGKQSGAYSCSVFGVDPFILMNYQDSLDDVSTLAHELGHSMHSIYAMQEQPAGSYHYTMFLAEIASTTNESLLNDYLYKNAKSDDEKIDLLVDKLENIRGTIYRQTLFAEFEWAAHTAVEQDVPIHAQWLNDKYAELLAKYYGPGYIIDDASKREWAYIPHFYYKYYVYSYATGLSSALSFAHLIESDPQNAVKYIDMLKAGSSQNSVVLLKNAGVDLNTPHPIEFALQEFNNTLTELEKLLDKSKN